MTQLMTSRKVLIVSGLQIYPTFSGGTLRSFALVNALARHGAKVFVYSFVGRKADYLARVPSGMQAWPGGVEEYVDRGLVNFIAGYSSYKLQMPPLWLTAYLRVAAASRGGLLPALLREKLAWCDVVVADFPFLYPVLSAAQGHAVKVLNTHNIEHHLYDDRSTVRSRFVRERVKRVELTAAHAVDILVTCCDSDRRYFEKATKVNLSVTVPNGIDCERFRYSAEERTRARARLGFAESVKVFLFTASKYGPNTEAFEFLLDFARANQQQLVAQRIHLLVVGRVVSKPVVMPAFTATGGVDSVEPYFAASDAAINPLEVGAGTNVKMAEFIAARLPVVVSAFGARGFKIEDERTGFLFERPHLMEVLAKVRLLMDQNPERLRRMVESARVENADVIDMFECVRPLTDALTGARRASQGSRAAVLG